MTETKEYEFLPQFKRDSVDETARELDKAYRNLYGKHTSEVRVPGADATEEQVKRFNTAMGVPDTEDGYRKASNPKAEEMLSTLRADAKKLGVPNKAWELFTAHLEKNQPVEGAGMKALEAGLESVDPKIRAAAKQGLDRLLADDPSLKAAIEDSGFTKSKAVVELLARAASKLGSDIIPAGESAKIDPVEAARAVARRIIELSSDPEMQRTNSQKKELNTREITKLQEKLFKEFGMQGVFDPRLGLS